MTTEPNRRAAYDCGPSFSTEARAADVERRLDAFRALLARRGAGAAFLKARRNFAWLTAGGENHIVLADADGVAPLLVTAERAVVLAPINEAARIADEEIPGLPLEIRSLPWHDLDAPSTEARREAAEALVGDSDLEDDLIPVRSVLSAFDEERLAWLGGVTGAALVAALDGADRGAAEEVAAAEAVATLGRIGVRAPVVLAAADHRIERYRHPLPGPTPAERRLMLVLVSERWGLHAAVTRIREFEPPSNELRRRIEATAQVERAMHEATVAGATLGDVLNAARAAYDRERFGAEWELHHQGGSIAYQGRETVAVPGDATRIDAGMAFAWNPSITGAKAEDTFILGADGSRRIVTGAGTPAAPPQATG